MPRNSLKIQHNGRTLLRLVVLLLAPLVFVAGLASAQDGASEPAAEAGGAIAPAADEAQNPADGKSTPSDAGQQESGKDEAFDPLFEDLLEEDAHDTQVHEPAAGDPFDSKLVGSVNFAGSAQLDMLYLPTSDHARDLSLDGFTTELSLKLAADVTDSVSVEVKTCFACHGFELGSAYVDVRPIEAVRLRAGKFVPRFGDFPQRHDPANHLTSDKPLPYDMGRMVRLREWNMSVLPAPYVDNGFEANVHHNIGEHVEMDYTAFVLGGLRGGNEAMDVDFIQSRTPALYYVDNNSEPSVGGRLEALFVIMRELTVTLGGSTLYGHYDPNRALDILIVAGDFVLRLWSVTVRAEVIARRTKMALGASPEDTLQYGPGADGVYDPYSLKAGFYVEVDTPLFGGVEAVARVDGMRRHGNVLLGSPLRSVSAVLRYTFGLNYLFAADTFRLKFSGAFYDFSDFSDEVALHLGLVGAF